MNKQEKLIERRKKNVPRGLFHISKHAIEKGHGARIIDVNGNELIDFASGVGVLNTGHTPEKVVRAVRQQAESYLHSCFNLMLYEPYIALAERLNEIIPAAGQRKTFFVNSGAEAVEHAVKQARHFTGRTDIITFHYAYHGRTLLTTTMTGRVRSYRTGFGPGVPGIHRAPYPYCYRCPFDARPTSCNLECFRSFKDLFIHTVPLNRCCRGRNGACSGRRRSNRTSRLLRSGDVFLLQGKWNTPHYGRNPKRNRPHRILDGK